MEGQAEVSKKFANGTEMNGTLTYQLSDPRTAQEFAKCWDKTANNWTVLPRVHVWFNEGKGEDLPTNVVSGGTHGPLSVGYGVGGSRAHIGPEYG